MAQDAERLEAKIGRRTVLVTGNIAWVFSFCGLFGLFVLVILWLGIEYIMPVSAEQMAQTVHGITQATKQLDTISREHYEVRDHLTAIKQGIEQTNILTKRLMQQMIQELKCLNAQMQVPIVDGQGRHPRAELGPPHCQRLQDEAPAPGEP